ncbi:MAG: DUF1178 family protein [Pseudomonadota bacterium]
MIRYSLKCPHGHRFESWFQSASAFETLQTSGHLECPVCGDTKIEKTVMSPRLASGQDSKRDDETRPVVAQPKPEVAEAMKKLKAAVEASSDYVGTDFADEARRIHAGEAEARSIHGEARIDDAKALHDEGIPVLPLPFAPTRKSN